MNNLLPRVAIIVPVFKKYESLNECELKLIEQIKTIFTNREILIIYLFSLEIDWKTIRI